MRRACSAIIDVLFVTLILCEFFAPGRLGEISWLRIVIGIFVIRAFLAFWPMFFRRPFIQIENDWIVLDGIRVQRENIRSGRVFSARVNGKMEEYLEVAFKTNPKLPLWFRLRQFFTDSGYPLRCAQGIPLAKKPRIIIPMGDTPLTDQGIHQVLTNHELAAPSDGDKPSN